MTVVIPQFFLMGPSWDVGPFWPFTVGPSLAAPISNILQIKTKIAHN